MPLCPHYGVCGACDRLDWPIGQQLRDKVASLEQLLRPFLRDVRVAFDRPRQAPQYHRTRLLYPARSDQRGLPVLGQFAARSHDIVPIRECRTQDEGLVVLANRAQRVLRELGLRAFDARSGKGTVRAFHARLAAGTGELLIGVVTMPGAFAVGKELAQRLLEAAGSLPHSGAVPTRAVGVVRSISARDDEFALGNRHVALLGRDYQEDRADGLAFRISYGSFYQIHRDASTLLYKPALAMVGPLRGARVVDGYGGIGTFGLRCARAGAAAVEIVEENPVACRDAEHNVARNGFKNVRVVHARFTDAEFAPAPDLLIVDPPRSGLRRDGVARVLAASPKRVLHVACSAESLATDLDGLLAGGYRVTAVRLCDLFPHTGHVELAAALVRA